MDILRVVMFKFCALHENPMPLLSLSYSCGGKELLMEYNPGGPPPQGYGPVLFTITTTATERKKGNGRIKCCTFSLSGGSS